MESAERRRPAHSRRVASRTYGDESVIIAPAENCVRMLNPVGTRIWELADGTRTHADIAAALTQEFDVDMSHAELSVLGFLRELEAKGLVTWS